MTDDGPFSGAGGLIERAWLVKLIEFGLSDANIEACFALPDGRVRLLRERYDLTRPTGSTDPGGAQDPFPGDTMDNLSDGLQAAISYIGSAIKYAKRDAQPSAISITLMEKTLEQLLRINKAYQSLQAAASMIAE